MTQQTAQHLQDTTVLQGGVQMPWLGLGVFQVADGEELVQAVKSAIAHGYRSIDTAAIYQNEQGVGQAIAEALAENGLQREELFITSKAWNADLGYEETLAAYEASLERLGLDYLDLYLIHWPVKNKYKEAWRALETLYKAGRVKAIGVSNFQIHHLEDLLKDAEIRPAVNQVELHPYLSQQALRSYCREQGIQIEAWSPLMQGGLLDQPELQSIAARTGKSVAQVILRWDLQHGIVTIPKSTKELRIKENAALFDFELSAEEMAVIDGLNRDQRVGPDPDNFDF
ncbi:MULTISPECIES: aldo/keto reductase [unclassified Paenibacillus]|uniref:aldo/keto reductase n=1 Tax=unclassified Paenibacillus TaxID=185978 RepID=UPI002404EFA7|nr:MULTISPECIES: aldo/keto reductase [unclassified Paenibacillus]MDF9839900.1 diketogulonate reductase-like aldo/keto reductase [Paenibacillus sp. PastF-2]MDF9846482.1 diketogulonate reductase-like aldo/keto reductase [Paenibacillus sp. PastM-2]MDF9853170.1 diketogulonate reductase-like aldo/keto reductase [Paenibacillus sp. PastF-1]MDH6478326.1 diketogulonate reductase-like aldo/keto reductase [Paenibacillus sp. PastH-2]MDH6506176.1 diketogulonate reductase-like aldo/keto reductase [Paenibaci